MIENTSLNSWLDLWNNTSTLKKKGQFTGESDVHYTQGLSEAVKVEKKQTQRRMTGHNSTTPWEENMEHLVHLVSVESSRVYRSHQGNGWFLFSDFFPQHRRI